MNDPIQLPFDSPPIMAMGADLKSTIALAAGRRAFVSQNIGDLTDLAIENTLRKTAMEMQKTLGIHPTLIAHDLHPDYRSTRIAQELAGGKIPLVAVQHHHAHIAACMAEHGLPNKKVIGIALDGAGLGTDNTIWGGEILVADYARFERPYHFRCVPLPGGDAAAREPWRMAVAYLLDAEVSNIRDFIKNIGETKINAVMQMIERNIQCVSTSSCGRLFDAVAAITGVCSINSFEGEAAIKFEQMAPKQDCSKYHSTIREEEIDFRPMICEIVDDIKRGMDIGQISARFHATVADAIANVCAAINSRDKNLCQVCLSGGCMQNARLTMLLESKLGQKGFEVFSHNKLSPNDSGIALGQICVSRYR